jgi:hypothetical protein
MRKFGVSSRTALAVRAVENGIISRDQDEAAQLKIGNLPDS